MKKISFTNTLKFYLGIIFLFIILLLLSKVIPSENLRFGQGEIYSLNEHWRIEYDSKEFEDIKLPYKVDAAKKEEVLASVKIPDSFPDNFKLRIRSSMQNIHAYVDGEEVFKTEKPESDLFDVPEASCWYIVDMPSNVQGKTLSLKISSSIKFFSGFINPVLAGEGEDLLFKTIYDQKIGLLIAVIIFIFGVFSFITSSLIKNLNDNSMLYLGVFAIAFSIWIFSESKILQFITGNRFIVGGITYITLTTIAIPFVLYLREAVLIKNKKKLTNIVLISASVSILTILFQIFGISKFIESIYYVNALQFIIVLYLIFLLFQEAIKFNNKEAKKLIKYMAVLLIFFIIELYNFYLGNYDYISTFGRIGIFIFLALIFKNTIVQLDSLILKEKETEIMKRLAYTDILTGGNNRAAFDRDFDEAINSEDIHEFRVIMMDINNLKYVNDNFGHQEGDDMIKLSYNTIKEVFNCNSAHYRIGGDEFSSIIYDLDEKEFISKKIELTNRLKELSKDLKYDIVIAIGSDIYSDEKFENKTMFLKHIDELMYENKKFLKGL